VRDNINCEALRVVIVFIHRFFGRIDAVLRRSLGVSETAPTDTTVKPAPPVDPELPSDQHVPPVEDGKAKVIIPEHMKNDVSFLSIIYQLVKT
jgi:hypothetical protein